jgi:NAD(P)-dependent dehydrogenase (short-subunit alcohol dehydrogenase family)
MDVSGFCPTDALSGRVAVIAAGIAAIGLATARRLATQGARCVLLYRSATPAAATAHAAALPGGLDQGNAAVHADITDITDSGTLRAAAGQACATTLRCATGTRIVVDGGRHL